MVFTTASGNVTRTRLEPLLKAVFARLAPERRLPEKSTFVSNTLGNWGSDEAYFTAEGDGLLIGENCTGAVAGEGIEVVYRLTVGDDVIVSVSVATDSMQASLEFLLFAPPEKLDDVTQALRQAAVAHGLVAKT